MEQRQRRFMVLKNYPNANKAGGKESDKCTLILTEGDSAKAVAVSCCVIVQSISALKLSLLGFTLYDFWHYSF